MKSLTFASNLVDHIKTEEVLAVPDVPNNNTPFWINTVLEWTDFGWSKIMLIKYYARQESNVGNNNCENLNPFSGEGFHF